MHYLLTHWTGDQSLAKSFFVNGILFYLLMVLIFAGVLGELFNINDQWAAYLSLAVMLVGFVWSFTGIIRSAIKVLKNSQTSIFKKLFAGAVVSLIIICILLLINDIRTLYF